MLICLKEFFFMEKRIFLDLETTGLHAEYHEIIEIGIIVEDTKGNLLEKIHIKVRPEKGNFDEQAIKINGFSWENWSDSKPFETYEHALFELLSDRNSVIIGHNPKFDYDFLEEAFFRCGKHLPYSRLVDTRCFVYEHLYPMGCRTMSLDGVRRFLGWNLEGSHRAMKDVEDTRNLFHLLNRMSIFRYWRLKFFSRKKLHA